MVQITLYAQPMGSEPYLNLSTFGVADEAAAEESQNIKGLTDIGRQVCETAQTMDEEASIAGTSMEGSSYEWGLRIEMNNLTFDMIHLEIVRREILNIFPLSQARQCC